MNLPESLKSFSVHLCSMPPDPMTHFPVFKILLSLFKLLQRLSCSSNVIAEVIPHSKIVKYFSSVSVQNFNEIIDFIAWDFPPRPTGSWILPMEVSFIGIFTSFSWSSFNEETTGFPVAIDIEYNCFGELILNGIIPLDRKSSVRFLRSPR